MNGLKKLIKLLDKLVELKIIVDYDIQSYDYQTVDFMVKHIINDCFWVSKFQKLSVSYIPEVICLIRKEMINSHRQYIDSIFSEVL